MNGNDDNEVVNLMTTSTTVLNPCPHYAHFRCSRSPELMRDRIQARMRGVPCETTDAVCEV